MTAQNETSRKLPVVVAAQSQARRDRTGEARAARSDAAFRAQALGQDGERRGLKGGAPVLSAARTAYLRTQWSGEDDRRPAPGLIRRDSV